MPGQVGKVPDGTGERKACRRRETTTWEGSLGAERVASAESPEQRCQHGRTIRPSHLPEAAMRDDNAKFDKEALSLIESLKGRRKPAKRAPRKAEALREKAAKKEKVVVRRAANRF